MNTRQNLPECTGVKYNCTNSDSCKSSELFNFTSLWEITEEYAKQCPAGPWLYKESNGSTTLGLTNAACEAIATPNWHKYPGSDIWQRLTAWKFPLFQLVANSPRPPLGFWVEVFVVLHFLGDPIGTISDLLTKIKSCQARAEFWQKQLEGKLSPLTVGRTKLEQDRLWKVFAIVVDSFDEWGTDMGNKAEDYLLAELNRLCATSIDTGVREKFLFICLRTADALAADRSTKFVPIAIAQAFFIASVAIAMIRTKLASVTLPDSIHINIEIYSISFTAQYFWVIFAVLWTSVIGVSQTEAAIPRILGRLRNELKKEFATEGCAISLPTVKKNDDRRVYQGGVYSWQPAQRSTSNDSSIWSGRLSNKGQLVNRFAIRSLFRKGWLSAQHFMPPLVPFFVVVAAAVTGQLVSALVPPVGWSCRSGAMLWMLLTWTVSYIISCAPIGASDRLLFWLTFTKDLVAVGVTSGIIIVTQFGIYNRCGCYTKYGRVALQLPLMPMVKDILQSRLSNVYPAIVTIGIVIQLIIAPSLLAWRYRTAIQMLLQRDDGSSNREQLYIWRRTGSQSTNESADYAGI